MAGMGPVPKPVSALRRPNSVRALIQLPSEGYQGPVPEWPLDDPTPSELRRWERVWTSPMAARWARMGGCELVVARYVRDCLLVENDSHTTVALAHLHAEVRQLEDRLGLSPLALLRLRWEIEPDEVAPVVSLVRARPRPRAV